MGSRSHFRFTRRALQALGVVAFVWACSDANDVVSGVPPAKLEIVVGDSQSSVVGKDLPTALIARVRDSAGHPISGVTVAFKVTAGGGSMFAGVSTSNDTGIVQDRWTLGTHTADSQRVEVRWVNPGTGEAVVFGRFAAIPKPDAPAVLVLAASGNFSQEIGTTKSDSLAARLTDQYGNAIRGDTVTWVALTGGGSVSPATYVTDTGGIARTTATMGYAMDTLHRFRATLGSAVPATFTGTPRMPQTGKILAVSGNGQTAVAGATLPDSVVIRASLADGRSLRGLLINFFTSDGTILSPTAVRTDTAGRAGVKWQLRVGKGSMSLQVVGIPPDGPAPTFNASATATAGTPTQSILISGNNQASVVGTAVLSRPVVLLRDQYSLDADGVSVNWVVTAGGGNVSPSTTISGSTGRDTAGTWTLGPTPGTQTLEARVTGGSTGVFTATAYAQFTAGQFTAGNNRACAIDLSGALNCWGSGGVVPFTDSMPGAVSGSFAVLSQGSEGNHVCGIAAGGAASCWGTNNNGQLGDGTTTLRTAPVSVSGGISFTAIATSSSASCGLSTGGTISCWGSNLFNSLGDGTSADHSTPAAVSGAVVFTAVTAGSLHMCGLAADSTAYCWGFSSFGQAGGQPGTLSTCIGNNQANCILTPTQVPGGRHFRAISAGGFHTCGLQADSTLYCWGMASAFKNGSDTPTPTLVNTSPLFASISGGGQHTCGVTAAHDMYCWGNGGSGALGTGSTSSPTSPTLVAGSHPFISVSAGNGRTCGVTTDNGLWCWGASPSGLGPSGSAPNVPQPVAHR